MRYLAPSTSPPRPECSPYVASTYVESRAHQPPLWIAGPAKALIRPARRRAGVSGVGGCPERHLGPRPASAHQPRGAALAGHIQAITWAPRAY